jgi:PD-(D/E)XK nuclease superfamily
MHPQFEQAHLLSRQVIGAAIEVHRVLGPGLLESIYERWLKFEEALRFDILVEGRLLVEVKAVEGILPVHKAIAMSYMKLLNDPLGLILNFHEVKLTDGVSRLILPGAGPSEQSLD